MLSGCGRLVFGPAPVIHSFSTDSAVVGWGEPVTLRWSASGASEFSLSRLGPVGANAAVVRPTETGDFVLTARGLGGTATSAPVHVEVTSSLALSAGVMNDGGAPGSVFHARLRTAAGAVQAVDTLVTIAAPAPGFPLHLICPAGVAICELRAPDVAPVHDFTASALLEGAPLQARFQLSPHPLAQAQVRGASVEGVSWDAVPGAVAYRVQPMDLDSAEPAGPPTVVRGTSAPGTLSPGVWVEALAADPDEHAVELAAPHVSRATAFVSAGSRGGTQAPWQVFAPADFQGDTLTASFGALGAGEHLAVLLVNAGGPDQAAVQLGSSGVAVPAAAATPVLDAPRADGFGPRGLLRAPDAVHEALRAAQDRVTREAIAAGVDRAGGGRGGAGPVGIGANGINPNGIRPHDIGLNGTNPDGIGPNGVGAGGSAAASRLEQRTSFCAVRGLDFGSRVRKPATLVLETAHAAFYADDEDLAHYAPGFFATIGAAFEDRVYPVDTHVFGAESDVDGNGKLTIFFTHELGAHLNGGWLIGYFGNNDLLRARDGSSGCGGTGSNHADLLYMNDVANGEANGYPAAELAATVFPATLAHELQHLINLNQRCLVRACSGPQETWINEGLSKVAEDLAGFGWNGGQGRWEGAEYLGHAGGGALRGYDARSLTVWEGDPIGNYQGAHSFLRYFTDRLGGSVAGNLAQGGGLERALGMPLPRAMAEWVTALLFSNERASPQPGFSFSGASWSPFHARLRHLDYRSLTAGSLATLRADGIAAFVTGAGQEGPAQITVRSSADRKPHVVVVRFSGDLPR